MAVSLHSKNPYQNTVAPHRVDGDGNVILIRKGKGSVDHSRCGAPILHIQARAVCPLCHLMKQSEM